MKLDKVNFPGIWKLCTGNQHVKVIDALVASGLCKSRREAVERSKGGAVSWDPMDSNGLPICDIKRKIVDPDKEIDISFGDIFLWCGKTVTLVGI